MRVAQTVALVLALSAVLSASPASAALGECCGSQAVSALAERLTGRPGVTVDSALPQECAADLGCADLQRGIIYMRLDLLSLLDRLNTVQPYQTALAVLVFCHEAAHIRFGPNEARAERWAAYHGYVVALLLGATKPRAARIRYWIAHRWNGWVVQAEATA